MILNRRLLLPAAAVALLPLMACSKTDDQPDQRRIFGSPPIITATPIVRANPSEVRCDFTNVFISLGAPPDGTLIVGMKYSELEFVVPVSDPDSDPDPANGQDDILAVTATFVPPGQPGDVVQDEQSLVLFDDGGANKFSFTQIGSFNVDCTSGPPVSCKPLSGFILTSNDQVAFDGTFERRLGAFDLQLEISETTQLVQDCLALDKGQVVIDVKSGSTFDFRVDAVDRAGNITTWPVPLPVTTQQTEFICEGDDCICCLIQFATSSICSGLPGLSGACGG